MLEKKLSLSKKFELVVIKILKCIPPFRGLYAMNTILSQKNEQLQTTTLQLLNLFERLNEIVQIHQTIIEKCFVADDILNKNNQNVN